MRAHTHACTHTHTCMHACAHTHTCTNTHTRTRTLTTQNLIYTQLKTGSKQTPLEMDKEVAEDSSMEIGMENMAGP